MLKKRFTQLQVIILLGLCFFLQYVLWFSQTGLVASWRLHKVAVLQQKNNESVAETNSLLVADIAGLKNGNEAIEARARHDLGMVKKNETYYQVLQLPQ